MTKVKEKNYDIRQISCKVTLNVYEMMAYTGWGENTCRELLKSPYNPFTYMVGTKSFANRKALDKYIDQRTGT